MYRDGLVQLVDDFGELFPLGLHIAGRSNEDAHFLNLNWHYYYGERLVKEGWPGPKDPPCSYCNRCLLNLIEHPLGCYGERRLRQYGDKSYEEMIRRVMAIFPDKTDSGWL